MDWGGYHNDEKPEEERFNTEDHLSNTSNDVQSNRGSPYYNSGRSVCMSTGFSIQGNHLHRSIHGIITVSSLITVLTKKETV